MLTKIKRPLVSVAAFGILLSWSLFVMPVGWLIWLGHATTGHVFFRRLARAAGWFYGRSSLLLLRPFIQVHASNPDAGVGLGPCIILANHQSALDLYLLGFQNLRQICVVAKAWPFKKLAPFRPLMRAAGYVEIKEGESDSHLEDCHNALTEDTALVVFPEGRRSRSGKLGKFHAGAFVLALKENVPIVPLVIRNSRAVLAPGSFTFSPGKVEIEMLPAILPAEYDRFRKAPLPHRSLLKYVKQLFQSKMNPLPDTSFPGGTL